MPRNIRKLIVTCPTAMSQTEQKALRQCASDAASLINRFFTQKSPTNIEVIPANINPTQSEWIYDEATAAQFVYLYAEIGVRYNNNVSSFFDNYGRQRIDLDSYDKKSLTIGSVDIGAGTTDVMIAAYKNNNLSRCEVTPVPLFWESFYIAGDDLLRQLVQRLVIEGNYSPIEKKLKEMGKSPSDYLKPFFGTNVGVSFRNKRLRAEFNLHVSIPIVIRFLELLKEEKEESVLLSYGDIFSGKNAPGNSLLSYFESHFGIDFTTLIWEFDKDRVSNIIEQVFESLIEKVSSLLSFYKCDIVLLSGRPTSLRPISDLFLKYYAIHPNRLKSMNNYRVGNWYPEDKRFPFVDGSGKFINPKSIVTTGAMLGYKASNGGINGFTLDLTELAKKLKPTTRYFGILDEQLNYKETIIDPETSQITIEVATLPLRIGARQLDLKSYPSRPFYKLDFDLYRIEDKVKGGLINPEDKNAVHKGIEEEKSNLLNKFPLKITISRNIYLNPEQLKIEEIIDRHGQPRRNSFLNLQVQSLSETDDFWMDSGLFSIGIN